MIDPKTGIRMDKRFILSLIGVALLFFALGVSFQSERDKRTRISESVLIELSNLKGEEIDSIETSSNPDEKVLRLDNEVMRDFIESLEGISLSRPNHPVYSGRERIFLIRLLKNEKTYKIRVMEMIVGNGRSLTHLSEISVNENKPFYCSTDRLFQFAVDRGFFEKD